MNKHSKKIANIYKKLGKKYLEDTTPLYPAEAKGFIKLISKNGLVLDVGCAGGRDSKLFVKNGFKVIGIDLVKIFIKAAKANVPKAKFYVMDLLDLKFPSNYFDAIWAQAVLLHVEKKNLPQVLKKFHAVLKPNGLIHIRVKRGRDKKIIVEKLSQKMKRPFTLFYKQELENYIKKAKFKIVKSRFYKDEMGRKNVTWIGIWAKK